MLKDRIAIVTGAASGIGEATARLFAEHGAQVLAVDLDGPQLDQAFAGDNQIQPFTQDIGAADAGEKIIGAVEQRWGKLDILFNNAGAGARIQGESGYRLIADTPEEHWRHVIEINLTAQFKLTRAAIPLLRKSGRGRVVMTGSPLAYRSYDGVSSYSASKAGLQAFAQAVAMEEGVHGITANWVEPSGIETAMTRHIYENPETRQVWANKSPLKRIGRPIDVANIVLFLASDLSGYFTGHGLCADGGNTLNV
jgi:NAD(P)-dependent dehydrogenase (short-subunit alcohol dehydrogenase family)